MGSLQVIVVDRQCLNCVIPDPLGAELKRRYREIGLWIYLKVELEEFVNRLDVLYEVQRRVENNARVFGFLNVNGV